MKAILLLLMLAACTTPQTVLKNQKTGQIAICGGNISSSFAGGAIGYHMQKSNDEDCVNTYVGEGFVKQ